MGILWFSWFSMNFNDPLKVSLPLWLRVLGFLFFITGVSLFVFAHAGMGRLKDEGHFVTTGIYSKIRNPMYLGFILWVMGFPVFLQSMLTLASVVLWIAHFIIWKKLEEKDLQRRFGGYREYKARTWF
jgi:protein-S-isoprenylcysteine O-methyltransferase Ste14